MATYQDRLRPVITLTSPLGLEFVGKWRGSNREGDKKLAMFDFPGIIGTVVQDLGMRSWLWPMTVYFDGPDNDKVAFRFATATLETGLWSVIHPVYGYKGLQIISVKEKNLPVDEGGYTAFDLEFIEPIDPITLKTAAQMSDEIGFQSDLVAVSSADQFLANIRAESPSDRFSLENAVNAITGPVDKILGPIAEVSDTVFETQNQIQRGIQDVLSATILQPLALAGQIQQLIQNPLRAITDIKTRLSAYGNMASELFGMTPDQPDNRGRNFGAVQELSMTSVMVANARIANTRPSTTGAPSVGGLLSRKQVMDTAVQIGDAHVEMNDQLELTQEVFQDQPIEGQYVVQSQSHYQTAQMAAQAISYLITSSYDLSLERRIILSKPWPTVNLAASLYKGHGEGDSNIDLFIESNDLHGFEVIRLPAGKEVVWYA